LFLLLVALAAAGCRQDMRDQARYKPLAASPFFADGRASRPLPPHTIARGHLRTEDSWFTGRIADATNTAFVQRAPVDVTAELLRRGQERFGIYCTPCHDRVGTGRGMIVRRGYTQPRSLHDPRLRAQPDGYYFDVMSNGFGNMPDYAAQVPIADRWAIVTYIRVLQLSQNAPADALTDEDRAALDAAAMPPSAPGRAGEGDDEPHEVPHG
jgi:mono/diheme cytochrome c family protein